VQHLGLEGLGVGLVVADEGEPVVGEHRRPCAQPGQLGVGEPEQVGDPHGVEHAAPGGLRGRQVGVPVEVEQSGGGVPALGARDDAEGDGAVATQNQG
jgi:hypothetical protein